MSCHSYPSSAMTGDYLRAGAGLCPSVAILACVPLGPVAVAILGGFVALFAGFGLRTVLRHATRLEATASGLSAAGPLPSTIRWTDLDRMKLAYYSTRRDRSDGWMQLDLRAGGTSLRLDSRLDGFNQLVERSAVAAAAQGIAISATTAANLKALGITAPEFRHVADKAEGLA